MPPLSALRRGNGECEGGFSPVRLKTAAQDLFAEETTPERLIGDKAYDSDPLDAVLTELGIEMIAPHRRNRRPENLTQDGRPLRRYRHRWIVERTFAWLGYHRRLLVRWEKHLPIFLGFTLLGCMMITLKRFGA